MWGADVWGGFFWGGNTAVPSLSPLGLSVLAGCVLASALLMRRQRGRRWALPLLVAAALMAPLLADADMISVENVFNNGTLADADEVNENFESLVDESNNQDARLSSLALLPPGAQ